MSIDGASGISPGMAAGGAAQSADQLRAAQEAGAARRAQAAARRTDSAAGLAPADDENHEVTDRDADGRRAWIAPSRAAQTNSRAENEPSQSAGVDEHIDLVG